ncbi:MAG: hypothetical protein P0Y65_16620 [Candidatus Devosia phytovorans]|uniref:Uncharacterized protein n=1 Tax=Candidatus Devosia phytovorans TaxID=3121372 RepID=A0AAJ5VUN8_9HYPH|nr:hypothetical protein [Devosia sp.]WEK03798.1 MAG: hypothetical protein P0Y65_16620 [Devosia sp.]
MADPAEIGNNPDTLAAHPDRDMVAVVSNTQDANLLQLVDYANGAFAGVVGFDLAELDVIGSSDTPQPRRDSDQWHPYGNVVAVNVKTQKRVVFYSVSDALELSPWGEPVEVGADPFVGRLSACRMASGSMDRYGPAKTLPKCDLDRPAPSVMLPRQSRTTSSPGRCWTGSCRPTRFHRPIAGCPAEDQCERETYR